MRIYIADLAAYNEGLLAGEWVELPNDDILGTVEEILERTTEQRVKYLGYEDLEAMEAAGVYRSEEWAIHDYEREEWYGPVSEYEDLEELNEAVEAYEGLEEYDQKKYGFLTNCQGYSGKDALQKLDDCDLYEDMSYLDLAYQFCDEGLFGDIPKHLENYIDYEAMARDLSYDYTEWNGDIFRCD